jgi:hypothetical protein
LVGPEDSGEDRQEPGYKQLGQELVVGVEEGDGAELGRGRNPRDLGEEADHTLTKGRLKLTRSKHRIKGSEEWGTGVVESVEIKLVREAVEAR